MIFGKNLFEYLESEKYRNIEKIPFKVSQMNSLVYYLQNKVYINLRLETNL